MRRPLFHWWCLRCSQKTQVVWIGPVEHNGQQAPAFFCEPCCEDVKRYIDLFTSERDARPAV